jgi:uncharacterized repeat protein (TIGR03806 family)
MAFASSADEVPHEAFGIDHGARVARLRRLFADPVAQTPTDGVLGYEVISPLYSDYTHKRRFMWIAPDTTVAYRDTERWAFPVGAILVKTFSYWNDMRDASLGERLLETRLLVHEAAGQWETHIYVWDEAQTTTERVVAGDIIGSSWIHSDGMARSNDYIVPNGNECQECHGSKEDGLLDTLGGRTRQLDRDGFIEALADRGWLDVAPPVERSKLVDPFGSAPLGERVRSYLDSNCGHCHQAGGQASQSALLLDFDATDPTTQPDANWGVCKQPTSAGGATCGHVMDVVPGDPATSIMLCRLLSTDPEVRMPPLVSRMPHDEGVALVSAWISAMTPPGCP